MLPDFLVYVFSILRLKNQKLQFQINLTSSRMMECVKINYQLIII